MRGADVTTECQTSYQREKPDCRSRSLSSRSCSCVTSSSKTEARALRDSSPGKISNQCISSLHSSSISTNNAASKQKAIIESDEDSDGYEIFDIINSDNLFKLMKEMKFANSTIGFIEIF